MILISLSTLFIFPFLEKQWMEKLMMNQPRNKHLLPSQTRIWLEAVELSDRQEEEWKELKKLPTRSRDNPRELNSVVEMMTKTMMMTFKEMKVHSLMSVKEDQQEDLNNLKIKHHQRR